ncbi:MAG: PQQ-dependent sugar dehydrogenase [Xanthomonadales bacterium]|nr:PQQ-dependent sugar dehydrogenase [Xanthomonadales bacterium]
MRKSWTAFALLMFARANAQTLPADLTLTDFCPQCGNFDLPLGIHQPPQSNLYIVNEKGGALKSVNADTGDITTLVDLSTLGSLLPGGFSDNGEAGLLSIAFHPEFSQNHYVYLSYSARIGDTAIARFVLDLSASPALDVSTRMDVILVKQDFGGRHNGGHIAFGPDGYLYIGIGDGGTIRDECGRAQTLAPSEINDLGPCAFVDPIFPGNADSRALLGKILRIDPDTPTPAGENQLCASALDGSANYAIPVDNPFAGNNGVAGACDEILHYGLRNPWRFSFDRSNGKLLIGDVGEGGREEISYQPAGDLAPRNFGWSCREGTIPFTGLCRDTHSLTDPVLEYDRAAGNTIIGGFVYRGPIVSLRGTYLYADATRKVWMAREIEPSVFSPQPTASNYWMREPGSYLVSFGEDQAGNLYTVDMSAGRILRITSAATTLFDDGFE